MRTFSVAIIAIFIFFSTAKFINATSYQFITVVNPVRISFYTKDPEQSIAAQYNIVKNYDLPATWLLTYDVLKKPELVSLFKTFDSKQELGLFLEVTPLVAADAEVVYHNTGSWHYATSVFLSGYTQEERRKLIDTLFSGFKDEFDYYPTSIGSWWTDAYSLSYMKEKYGITATLDVSDQYSTDGYQVWGQPWSTPFYPSRIHAGIPAQSEDNKLDIVVMQWAPRHPYEGYFSSLYSTQDYRVAPEEQHIDFFENLISIYGKKHSNQFGHIVIGLESDFNPEDYAGEFNTQMALVEDLAATQEFTVSTMKEFSDWYRKQFPELSPTSVIESPSALDSTKEVWWYQSPFYRTALVFDSRTQTVNFLDLRVYKSNFQEPYFLIPNKEFDLSIYIPSIVDQVSNPHKVWNIATGDLKDVNSVDTTLKLIFTNGDITLNPKTILVNIPQADMPAYIQQSPDLNFTKKNNTFMLEFSTSDAFGPEGYEFEALNEGSKRNLLRKRTVALVFFGVVGYILLTVFFIRSSISRTYKAILVILPLFFCGLMFNSWLKSNSTTYYVSQSELDALKVLSLLPHDKVVVYDRDCLGCSYTSTLKPAVFANERSYISTFSQKQVIKSKNLFETQDREEGKKIFNNLLADYLYLVSYEGYQEKIPFSPGDLGIEKIYENAHAQIWQKVQ